MAPGRQEGEGPSRRPLQYQQEAAEEVVLARTTRIQSLRLELATETGAPLLKKKSGERGLMGQEKKSLLMPSGTRGLKLQNNALLVQKEQMLQGYIIAPMVLDNLDERERRLLVRNTR